MADNICTAHQIVDKDGEPSKATVTSNLWVSDPGCFAGSRDGNDAKYFVSGKAYFADLLAEFAHAKSQILIAGWQISWDALLAPGVRLYDALLSAAKANPALKIYIMPWDDREPVQTYDDQTIAVFLQMNKKLGREQVYAQLSPTYAVTDKDYYAHHQKLVVIDQKIAYVGGMDLAYGRYCDEHYTLRADADGREGMNRYNGGVAQVGTVRQSSIADPDLLSWEDRIKLRGKSNAEITAERINSGGIQPKYESAGMVVSATGASTLARDVVDLSTLDPTRQPRMPWQDVHCRIQGPAVSDVLRNFIARWNVQAERKLPPAPPPNSFAKAGNMSIQVLRSAPANHCVVEGNAKGTTQHDIYTAMLGLIEKSRRFIYIENQFFVSDFGQEDKNIPSSLTSAAQYINTLQSNWATPAANTKAAAAAKMSSRGKILNHAEAIKPPTNQIVSTLLKRIKKSALSGSSWHAYITLPVHSEGSLSDPTIVVQVYWTMQTLVFGSNSLLNGIRKIILARDLIAKCDKNYKRVFQEGNEEYLDIDIERCEEFVTLLNLRNWAKLGERYVTEQVYVHSKVMIVDDMYAIIGSANINDRSLLGERDSELAVLIQDNASLRADVNGKGSSREVRRFAHDLRKALWNKIFGLTAAEGHPSGGSNVKPAAELKNAIEQPGLTDSWKHIQKCAKANAKAYEATFAWIPRSKNPFTDDIDIGASILPTWKDPNIRPTAPHEKPGGVLKSPMPFQADFWSRPRHNSESVDQLSRISGYITSLPIKWTKGENNRFEYPSNLVTDKGKTPNDIDNQFSLAQSIATQSKQT